MQNLSSTLQILLAQFNGAVLIPFAQASEAVGIPQQTARNRLSSGTYPMQTVTNGARRFVHISDLADFVESLRPEPPKPKRGRPRKSQKLQSEKQVMA